MNHRTIARKLAPVAYEDEQFLFVNKPAGLPSRGTAKGRPPDWLAGQEGMNENESWRGRVGKKREGCQPDCTLIA